MDYLVVAPHTPFFHWQIALLLQSFRQQNKQDDLAIILIASNRSPLASSYYKLFENHPRMAAICMPCDNEPDIMRLHALAYGVKNAFVSQTFTLIPPYSIFHHPVSDPNSNIATTLQPDFSLPLLECFGLSGAAIAKRTGHKQWLPVGDVFVFDKMPTEFFDLLVGRGELMAFDSYRTCGEKTVQGVLRAAMSLAIMEKFSSISLDTTQPLESRMGDYKIGNFINYYYGSPPDFSRTHHKLDSDITFAQSPFHAILQSPDTRASMFMKEIVRSLIEKE